MNFSFLFKYCGEKTYKKIVADFPLDWRAVVVSLNKLKKIESRSPPIRQPTLTIDDLLNEMNI